MMTRHQWFRSGKYSLLAHVDLCDEDSRSCGVVIVPPFGWEDVCCYRPLRFMARMFAENGIPTLRFDLPGTGDSSGDAQDPGLFDAWIDSIANAAEELRALTHVRDVAVLGVRMGATLTLAAAVRRANIRDLILWAPFENGNAAVRELRAFSKMARAEYATGAATSPAPGNGLEAGGFLLAPETQRALEALEFEDVSAMQASRVLLLTPNARSAEDKLTAALRSSCCTLDVRTSSDYQAMMQIPEEALPSFVTGQAIIDFLTGESPVSPPEQPTKRRFTNRSVEVAEMETADGRACERIYPIQCGSASNFGILTTPVGEPVPVQRGAECDPRYCVIFLNAGAVRHTGPNRMWVQAARRLAAQGVPSLRLDLGGIGESDGVVNRDVAGLYQERLVEQVDLAMQSLRNKLGVQRFALVGLCAGAFWAFHAALRYPEIRAAILLNPRLFFWDPEVDKRRVVRRTARLLTESTDWGRLMRGYVSLQSYKRVAQTVLQRTIFRFFGAGMAKEGRFQIPPEDIAKAWRKLARSKTRLSLIFTEGEPLLREMEEEGHLPPPADSHVRCIRLSNCGHTFRPLWAQAMVHELIERELAAAFHHPEHQAQAAARGSNGNRAPETASERLDGAPRPAR